jgi:hypothetical protein
LAFYCFIALTVAFAVLIVKALASKNVGLAVCTGFAFGATAICAPLAAMLTSELLRSAKRHFGRYPRQDSNLRPSD